MNFLNDVIDLYVFDTNNNLITEIKTLQIGDFIYNQSDNTYDLNIKDVQLNFDLLEFAHDTETKEMSDYERILDTKNEKVIEFGGQHYKECKLIAKTYTVNQNENIEKNITFEIPDCKLYTYINIISDSQNISKFDYVFKIYKYDNKHYFKIRLK